MYLTYVSFLWFVFRWHRFDHCHVVRERFGDPRRDEVKLKINNRDLYALGARTGVQNAYDDIRVADSQKWLRSIRLGCLVVANHVLNTGLIESVNRSPAKPRPHSLNQRLVKEQYLAEVHCSDEHGNESDNNQAGLH